MRAKPICAGSGQAKKAGRSSSADEMVSVGDGVAVGVAVSVDVAEGVSLGIGLFVAWTVGVALPQAEKMKALVSKSANNFFTGCQSSLERELIHPS